VLSLLLIGKPQERRLESDSAESPRKERWQEMLRLGRQIAEGLQVLHEHRLHFAHRNLHEETVLISSGDIVIGGFSKVKSMADGRAHTSWPGKDLTIPPEALVYGGLAFYDCSYDIYGLGLLLAKMALWALLPQVQWSTQRDKIHGGPSPSLRLYQPQYAIQEWQQWLLDKLKSSCCAEEEGKGEGAYGWYWTVASECLAPDPTRRPKASSVLTALTSNKSTMMDDQELSRMYQEALQSGQVTLRLQRLLILGQGRAGKTSLYNALKGGKFNPEEPTTEVFSVDVNSVNAEGWKKVSVESMLLQQPVTSRSKNTASYLLIFMKTYDHRLMVQHFLLTKLWQLPQLI